jgi:hypothetical protein
MRDFYRFHHDLLPRYKNTKNVWTQNLSMRKMLYFGVKLPKDASLGTPQITEGEGGGDAGGVNHENF